MSKDTLQIRKTAMDFLARREHSRYELFSKLDMRGFDESEINSVIDQLQKENLQSDERFAEAYLKSKTNRGYGPVRVRQELHDRGITDEMIALVLAENEQGWLDVAKHERIKKFGADRPNNYEEKAKQMRFLQYRGFTFDQINKVLGDRDE
jgi:regulatory protein